MKKASVKNKRGFTLIELMVVISIIAVLTSIVFSAMNSARVKARDARRVSDLNQIKTALELFYAAKGYYPQADCGWDGNCYRSSYDSNSWNAFAADLAPYIKLPKDPINSACGPWNDGCYSYTYGNVGRTTYKAQYDLTAQFENANDSARCAVRAYRWFFNDASGWCAASGGSYSNYVYEVGN